MPCQIAATAQTRIVAAPEAVFDTATTPEVFPQIFLGGGLVPAVVRIELVDNVPQQAGSRRLVHNSDGSQILEEILAFDRAGQHRYRLVSGFRFPLTLLIRGAVGNWEFVGEGDATRVCWELQFELTSRLARPVAAWITRRQMQPAMQAALERLRELVEAEHAGDRDGR